jgi:hypothetical protein
VTNHIRVWAKIEAKNLKRRWGTSWHALGYAFQDALAIERVFYAVTSRDDANPVKTSMMMDYLGRLRIELGLDPDQNEIAP